VSRAASPTAALGRPVTIRAHAKINLDLRVLGMRADGFHELRTVFQSLALHDSIDCIPRPGPFAIECDAAGVPLDESNLVWRAASTLWRALRRSGPVRDVLVRLHKRIPLQGGLGGGSTDAAATLLGLARMWRVPVRPPQLVDVATTLGADVAFFLSGGEAMRHAIRDLVFAQDGEKVIVRVALMQEHRFADARRDLQLLRKRSPLQVARREIPKVVEAAFAHRDDAGLARQGLHHHERLWRQVGGMMGMHTRGGEQHARLRGRERDCLAGTVFARSSDDHLRDAGRGRVLQHRRAIGIEAVMGEVDADVDQLHAIRASGSSVCGGTAAAR